MIAQAIIDIPEILFAHGVREAIISPGSRSAPLTLSFARNEKIRCTVVPDERSAAFIALGMALRSGHPVALVCTSGSAGLNYAPAVAEAYYQQVPLIVLTADRPPEWIDQWDGQTIRQNNLYGNHILKSYTYPVDLTHVDAQWHANRIINEAAINAQGSPAGPVHVNIPFREPLYPEPDEAFNSNSNPRIFQKQKLNPNYDFDTLIKGIGSFQRILIVAGQQAFSKPIAEAISTLAKNFTVITDAQSNLSAIKGTITHHDLFLAGKKTWDALAPDLVISFGLTVISKNLKLFLRNQANLMHWQFRNGDFFPDTFQALEKVIPEDEALLCAFLNTLSQREGNDDYYKAWESLQRTTEKTIIDTFEEATFNEFAITRKVLNELPDTCDIHVSNSMPIRYVNFLGIESISQQLFVNRGTSGIDGSVSTAVGSALAAPERPTFLITGDLAFLYDRNGLWHNNLPQNLKIIVLNNRGGGIFAMIPGPKKQPELETFFVTDQRSDSRHVAAEHQLAYYSANNWQEWLSTWPTFLKNTQTSLIEVFTDRKENEAFFTSLKQKIAES